MSARYGYSVCGSRHNTKVQWLWQFDQDAYRAIHIGLHRDWLDPLFWIVSSSGLGWVQAIVVLILPVLASHRRGELLHPGRSLFRGAWQSWRDPIYLVGPMLFAIAFSGLVLSGVLKKMLIERERPSNFSFAHPQETFYYNSFPSGHTTTTFAVAFMLLFVTWDTPHRRWGRGAMVWACLVGFSRIYRGVHWPTDVLGGVFAGLVSACLAYLLARRVAAEEPDRLAASGNDSRLTE